MRACRLVAAVEVQIVDLVLDIVMEIILPSGEKRPLDSPEPVVSWRSLLLPSSFVDPSGTIQRWLVLVFFSRLTSVTEKRTHLPEGEIWGSEMRFMACRSAKVMGRLGGVWAARVVAARARRAARRMGEVYAASATARTADSFAALRNDNQKGKGRYLTESNPFRAGSRLS